MTGIRFFDLSGKPVRVIETTAALSASTDFSPDGTRIALSEQYPSQGVQIVAATTGQVVQRVSLPAAGRVLGWYDDDHLMVGVFGDRGLEATLQIVGLDGSVMRTVRLLGQGNRREVGVRHQLRRTVPGRGTTLVLDLRLTA